VIVLVRLIDGVVKKGDKMLLMSNLRSHEVLKVGVFAPVMKETASLSAGEVGFIIAGIKEVQDAKIGDTITILHNPCEAPLPGFKEVSQWFSPASTLWMPPFMSSYAMPWPSSSLTTASFSYEPETSLALGFGFRCGFLGLLHMEIIQERLEREFNLELITTAPTVIYKVHKRFR
jgi:GTP-binding protein LepA